MPKWANRLPPIAYELKLAVSWLALSTTFMLPEPVIDVQLSVDRLLHHG